MTFIKHLRRNGLIYGVTPAAPEAKMPIGFAQRAAKHNGLPSSYSSKYSRGIPAQSLLIEEAKSEWIGAVGAKRCSGIYLSSLSKTSGG